MIIFGGWDRCPCRAHEDDTEDDVSGREVRPRHPYANLPLGATSTLRLHKISCSGDQDPWNDQASVPQAVVQEFGVQARGSIVDLALNFVRRPPRSLHKLTASLACSAIQLASISILWWLDDCSPKLAGIAAGGGACVGYDWVRDRDKRPSEKYRNEIVAHETKYDRLEHSAQDTLNRLSNMTNSFFASNLDPPASHSDLFYATASIRNQDYAKMIDAGVPRGTNCGRIGGWVLGKTFTIQSIPELRAFLFFQTLSFLLHAASRTRRASIKVFEAIFGSSRQSRNLDSDRHV
ncbi:hypothetical protein ARMGADRAFT_1086317 [Armillaria gallica]|uniref:Uncharacterized protein n=1 Tax=Armillaria gallica TaxID=47427 RepID=A0A2H3DCL4_ARMGA|nr:hypothetical protein ARMGADRAFT_1086317 [Armillaria gallica]